MGITEWEARRRSTKKNITSKPPFGPPPENPELPGQPPYFDFTHKIPPADDANVTNAPGSPPPAPPEQIRMPIK